MDLLPNNEAVLLLYARTWLYALASIDKGLCETHPLYRKMLTHQRVSVLASCGGVAIRPDGETVTKFAQVQELSDMAAAYEEIRQYFACRIVFEEDT